MKKGRKKSDATDLQGLYSLLGDERVARLRRAASAHLGVSAEGFDGVATRLLATRAARWPRQVQAGLWDAAIGLICACGAVPEPAEIEAFHAATETFDGGGSATA